MKQLKAFIKRWSFLLLFLVCGAVYLAGVDQWQVYAKAYYTLKEHGMPQKQDKRVQDKALDRAGDGSGQPGQPFADGTLSAESGEWENPKPGTLPEENAQAPSSDGIVYETVTDDYFADAVFIGDSRTVGMYEYGELEDTADFYASTGLTVYKLFDTPVVKVPGQRNKATIEEMLSQKKFGKIYLMIGINEMGTGTVDTFIREYEEAVAHLRELQPDAIIYIQGIMKVTEERSGQGDYINNRGIEERNERLSGLADNRQVFYLDVNPKICDETGGMESSYTFDGVHLKAQYISVWKDFLKEHAVKVSLD